MDIKKHITDIKKKSEKRIQETKVVKTRLMISEDISGIFSEVKYLKKQKYNKQVIEENLLSVLNQMFDQDGPLFMETVKTKLTEFLMSKLSIGEFEKKVVEKAIGDTDIEDVPKLFTEPRFLASKLAEVYNEDFSTEYLENLPEFMKSKVAKLAQDPNSEKELEDMFVDILSPVMGDINSKMDAKMKDIRDNIVS